MATRSDKPLYRSLGYAALGRAELLLPDGLVLPVLRMTRRLDTTAAPLAA